MINKHFSHIIGLVCLLLLGSTANAWALQSHGPPEGIYVHQMAHILFSGALGYLYWHTRKTPITSSKGWKYLQFFCCFLILWNILAFIGHEVFKQLEPSDFIDKDSWREQLAGPVTLVKATYYITKMDHFLNVPALLALVISLRTFYLEVLWEEKK
jgi:hypothetical protein